MKLLLTALLYKIIKRKKCLFSKLNNILILLLVCLEKVKRANNQTKNAPMHLPYLHQYIKANFDNILKERGVITIKLTPQSPRKEETDNEGMFTLSASH